MGKEIDESDQKLGPSKFSITVAPFRKNVQSKSKNASEK